jgi:spermidine/putrescine transport system substrate-binding protein
MKAFIRSFYILLTTLVILTTTYLISYSCSKNSDPNTLNIFVWGDFFPEETLKQFESETGIKLNVNYYGSNEELVLKLESTKGLGYDLVFPSDYGVTALKEKNLLKPLEKSKFNFMDRIEPYLLDCKFDRKNQYSIPYSWEVYGITHEKKNITKHFQPSIAALFEGTHKVVMTADPVEAIDFAAHYLFGYKNFLSPKEETKVINLLKTQKKRVEAYTDDRVQYMISSEDCPVALLRVSFFWKNFETLPHLQIYLPNEGVFTTIENVSLSVGAEHIDAAYKFINFIYKPEIMAKQLDLSPLFPACRDALRFSTFANIPRYHEILNEIQNRNDFFFTHYLIPQNRIRTAWVEIKS